MLYDLSSLLSIAQKNSFAVGAFNVNSYLFADAFLNAAEKSNSAIILQVSPGILRAYQGTSLIPAITCMANYSTVPVCIHLDHAKNSDDLKYALQYKHCFTSYMVDGSNLKLKENIQLVNDSEKLILSTLMKDNERSIYEDYTVYSYGIKDVELEDVFIEAEIGHVGSDSDDCSQSSKIEDILSFVKDTNCKALAISIGNSHGEKIQKTELDIDLLKEIRSLTDIPLVLHGSSGVKPSMIKIAIKNGITKVNVNTLFKEAVKKVYENNYKQFGSEIFSDYKNLQPRIFETIVKEAIDCIKNFNSENSANYFKN